MKKIVRLLGALMLAVVGLAVVASPALADDYTYTVRVLGGNRGTVKGQSVYVIEKEFAQGEYCNLDLDWVTVTDSKYYAKGFRLSGADASHESELHPMSFPVTEDTDLVVAYGVEGNMTDYTVHFRLNGTDTLLTNEEGNTSRWYVGKVGDRPVVAYDYIPGYRPLYRNITGTLQAGGNDWYFDYVPLAEGETEDGTVTTTTTTTTTVVAGGTTTGTAAGTTGTATGTATGGTAVGTEGGEGGAEGAATDTTAVGTAVNTPPATQDILDVDNPLAAPDDNQTGDGTEGTETEPEPETKPDSGAGNMALIAGLLISLIAALVVFILIRRKKDGDEDELI